MINQKFVCVSDKTLITIAHYNSFWTSSLYIYVLSTSQLTQRLSYTKNSLFSVEGDRLFF